MFKQAGAFLIGSLCILSPAFLTGDQPGPSPEGEPPVFEESPPAVMEIPSTPTEETPPPPAPVKAKAAKSMLRPFTGKIKGKKVRLRLQPDLESSVVKELHKGELLSIVSETDEFYAVEAPSDIKAYVFRSFVLDNQIEGNRVNVRLQPNLEAPILAHLNAGDKVETTVCSTNNKWLEIPVPTSTRFYVAKEFIENCGGPEVKVTYETRRKTAKQQLEMAEYLAEGELQKTYPSIDFDKMNHNFQMVIQEYAEFSDLVDQARSSLAKAQEQFLDKRISYLETRSSEEALAQTEGAKKLIDNPTDKMKMWQPVEEALYTTWASTTQSGNIDEYYEEQRLTAERLCGILEPYLAPVKCKPGDYIIRHNDLPVGYVYSTVVNLQDLIGKKVTLIGSPRPNNNFAFPAYFIFDIEN